MIHLKTAIYSLMLAILTFIIFGYDIENDKDFFRWMWLLSSELFFLVSLRSFIIHDRKWNS